MTADTDIAYASAHDLLDLYRSKGSSPVEAVRALLDRIEILEPKLNAFCILDREGALAAASRSERECCAGHGDVHVLSGRLRVSGCPAAPGCE